MEKQTSAIFQAFVKSSTVMLSAFSMPTQALPIINNGSFEVTIGRATNNDKKNPVFDLNDRGMLGTSANITGPSTTPITLSGWNTSRDGIACVVFPNTYVNGVCGPDRFSGSGFQAGGPGLSPDKGNFVLIDGDRSIPVSTSLYQKLDGLIVGSFYDVSFYQAAAQFLDRSGSTTERWDVSLGGKITNLTFDGNFIDGVHVLSDLMNTPSRGFHAWESQTLRFQVVDPLLSAGSLTSQLLSFFSVGTPGGQPPIVLLDGIRITAVPEPKTLALVGLGLLAVLVNRKRKPGCV